MRFTRFILRLFLLITTLHVCGGSCLAADQGIYSLKLRAKNLYYGIGGKQDYKEALNLYLKAADYGDPEAKYIAGAMYFKGLGTDKNFEMAFKLLHQAAIDGRSSPESQKILGEAYLIGLGTHKNYTKALEWYALAADNGNGEAQNELGYMYFVGHGVEQDVKKGGELFAQAARNGMAIAQYNMGIMYYTGNGVESEDLLKAYAWMNIAAARGHGPAIAARNYLESILSTKELVEAQSISDGLLNKMP